MSSSAQHSPNQTNSLLNGISQTLDGTSPLMGQQGQGQQNVSPSIAGRPLPPASQGSSGSTLPPQLSNLLLQQHLVSQRQPQNQQQSNLTNSGSPLPQTPAQQVLFSPADRFGLLGLLNIIKMSADPDFSMVTLGGDLEKLGLDLGSSG